MRQSAFLFAGGVVFPLSWVTPLFKSLAENDLEFQDAMELAEQMAADLAADLAEDEAADLRNASVDLGLGDEL